MAPLEALLDLPSAEVDALFGVGDRGRVAIIHSGEMKAHAHRLAVCGITKVDAGDGGFMFVGPRSKDDDARAELAAMERGEQREREAAPAFGVRQREMAAAARHLSGMRRLHLRLASRALAAIARLRPRPRSRRRRSSRTRRGGRAAARAGDGSGPGEPEPPRAGGAS